MLHLHICKKPLVLDRGNKTELCGNRGCRTEIHINTGNTTATDLNIDQVCGYGRRSGNW